MIPKPRLRQRFGVWSCITWSPRRAGFGYTPKEAYDEWVKELSMEKTA